MRHKKQRMKMTGQGGCSRSVEEPPSKEGADEGDRNQVDNRTVHLEGLIGLAGFDRDAAVDTDLLVFDAVAATLLAIAAAAGFTCEIRCVSALNHTARDLESLHMPPQDQRDTVH